MSTRRGTIAWLVLAAVVLVAALRWVDLHPIRIHAPEPRAAGEPIWRLGDSPVALLAAAPGAAPASFDESGWSWAWLNALEQEFGPADVVDLGSLPPALPPWSGAILAGEPGEAWRAALDAWVRGGGRLLVDGCGAGWPAAAVDRDFGWDDLLDRPAADALRGLAPAATVARRARLGEGTLTVLGMCGGRLLQSLQQGRPAAGFGVEERAGAPDLRTPVDLSVLPPETAEVPVADLLERRLLDLAFGDRALAGLWHVPEGRPGAYLPSHDEEGFGDRALFQADHEKEVGARSSFFIIPGEMSAETIASLCAGGFEVGLHWDRGYPRPRMERLGIGPFRPLQREVTLEDQLAALRRSLPAGCAAAGNRNHGLLWTADYAGAFERLGAAGLRHDSTYGPDGDRYGYVFGTGLPFRPLDARGLPLPILEVPFQFQDDERFERDFVERFLEASAAGQFVHVGLLAHPTTMGWRPSVDRFDAWLESYEEARGRDQWIGTIAGIADFWARRTATRLAPSAGGFEAEASGDDLWLWVRPAATEVVIDGEARAPDRVLRPAGVDAAAALYPLPAGRHRVDFR